MDATAVGSLSMLETPSLGQGAPYLLCEVCNVQLTSAARAHLHYNGRSHLRRIRRLQAGDRGPQTTGGRSRAAAAAEGLCCRPAGPTAHSAFRAPQNKTSGSECGPDAQTPGLRSTCSTFVRMKSVLSFAAETTSPAGLFPNFNMMDPVQKAVINHTFGIIMLPKKKHVISCNICQLRFNSDSQADAHFRGSRHTKKIKSLENKAKLLVSGGSGSGTSRLADVKPSESATGNSQHEAEVLCSLPNAAPSSTSSSSPSLPASSLPVAPPPSAESEDEKAKKLLYCSLCKVAVNSLSQLEAHTAGLKHKTMLEARSGGGPIKAYPRPGARLRSGSAAVKGSGLQNKSFHCQICDVHVNSEIQLKQHISSRRHKDRLAGKPDKPKYRPYDKQQCSSLAPAEASPSSSFLPPSFSSVSSPLSTSSLLTPASSPLSASVCPRRHSALPSCLFTASLLRAAPGPVRSNRGAVVSKRS